MSEQEFVQFHDVGKAFRRKRLKSFLLHDLLPGRTLEHESTDLFWALRHVSFSVGAGESVAIVGANGSGKSTTLALAAGASYPTEGRVSVRGRIAPVLELGVGFEPDMTAAENAYVSASLLGVGREEVSERIAEILAFAGLGDFEHVPVRNYSSGMVARLGFGVAMHVNADVLLVDEVLAVGDGAFQQKCLERLKQLQGEGTTLLFVSHEAEAAKRFCSRALWIRDGKLEADGSVDDVIGEYHRFLYQPDS